jgi:chromosomal replication initiator protein
MSGFWNSCLSQFEQELSPQQFNTWIRSLRLESEDASNGELRLVAPNGFILKWVKEHYLERIKELGNRYFSTPIDISLSIAPHQTDQAATPGKLKPAPPADHADALPAGTCPTPAHRKTRLIRDLTMDSLVGGDANEVAYLAALHVATRPGENAHNPLFIYGNAGLGKTHLIHAIGNRIVEKYPEKSLRYVHADDYFTDVVRAVKTDSFDAFKQRYQSLDVFLLDDIQFLNRKAKTQEEFFFLFNALIGTKKQMVITCDTYPKNIPGLEDRLITRLNWGLTVQIDPPDLEMRVAILEKKAEAAGLLLEKEIAYYIAKHLCSNVRELEGALKKVLAYAKFHRQKVSLELAKDALKDLIGAVNRQISIEDIQKTVAEYFKIKIMDILSSKKTRSIVRPRQIAMWLSKNLTSQSYPAIGKAFGGRDHTTVLHAVRTIDTLRKNDKDFNTNVHMLSQMLKG